MVAIYRILFSRAASSIIRPFVKYRAEGLFTGHARELLHSGNDQPQAMLEALVKPGEDLLACS
jgi:hypothetical protein